MADRGGFRGGFGGRGGDRGGGDRGGRGGDRGDRGGRRGGRRGRGRGAKEEKQWVPVTKLGRLVQANKIANLEDIYYHALPIKVRKMALKKFLM